MEVIGFRRKWVCVFLILSMMLQSCSVYRKKTITLDEAIAKNSKVRVTKLDGNTAVFNKIEKVDSIYYGLPETDGESTRVIINESDYKEIQPKNKPASALLSIGVIVVPLAIAAAIIGYGR